MNIPVQKKRNPLNSRRRTSFQSRGMAKPVQPLTNTASIQTRCACGGGCPQCQSIAPLQTQLRIGAPHDRYEQEADRVAEQVMRMPDSEIQLKPD